MTLRTLKLVLMAGAGWTVVAAAPVFGATCHEQLTQIRQDLTETSLSRSERREYQTLLEAAQAMQQTGDEQVCRDIVSSAQGLLTKREAAPGVAPAARYAALKDAVPLSQIARFEDVRKLDVVNSKGEHLGNLVDLVLDFDGQQIQYALLSTSGGFFGSDKLYPVPINVLRIGDDPDAMPAADAAGTAARPPIAATEPTSPAGSVDPALAVGGPTASSPQPTTTPAMAPADSGELGAIAQMTVGELVGSEVKNDRDQSVGEIDAVILPPGAVQAEAVLSVGGFVGLGDKHVAIPLSRLTQAEGGLRFKTPVTEDELKALPEVEVGDQDRLPDETVIAAVVPPPAAAGGPAEPGGDAHSATVGQATITQPSAGAQASATDPATPATMPADAGAQASNVPEAAAQESDPLADKVLVLDIDRATLEQAPGFSEDDYPDLANADWHRTVLAFYEDVLHLGGGAAKPKSD